jgi:hypothetical protein
MTITRTRNYYSTLEKNAAGPEKSIFNPPWIRKEIKIGHAAQNTDEKELFLEGRERKSLDLVRF